MFCNSVFNSLVLDNKLIKFLLYLYYKINALKSLFVEIDFNFKVDRNTFMFCNSVFNSLVLDNKLIKFLLYLYYKINALKSLFVEIDFNLSSTYCGVISTTDLAC